MSLFSVELTKGPLDEMRLHWIADLYGRWDAKYRSIEYLRHQFIENPFGWSLHAFAFAGDVPIGHCAVVPLTGRRGDQALVVGKVEAFFIAEEHRAATIKREDGETPLALAILTQLYDSAESLGVQVLFAVSNDELGVLHRLAGCRRIVVPQPMYLAVTSPRSFARRAGSRKLALAGAALFAAQRALGAGSVSLVRLAAGSAGRVSTSTIHADLQELPAPAIGMEEWTVVGGESWQWYAGSGTIQQVRVRGRQGSSGIVTGGASGEPLQIVHWIPRRRNLLAALLFVHACTLVARRAAAPSAQLHAWDEPAGGTLVRACRLLGFVRVRESLTLYVRSPTPELRRPEAVRLTPYFSLSF